MLRKTLKTLALTACMSLAWSASALASITVQVITTDELVFNGTTEEVILPTTSGRLGVSTGHMPFLTSLEVDVMEVRDDGGDWVLIAVMGGFAELENDELTILLNEAELGSAIDSEQARTEFIAAEERLQAATAGENRQERIRAQQAYKRARARYRATGAAVD